MNDDRIEALLRVRPADEPTYQAPSLGAVHAMPVPRSAIVRTLGVRSAVSVMAVVVAIAVAGLALSSIGGPSPSPAGSDGDKEFTMTLANPDGSHPVEVVLVDKTGLAIGFAPDLPNLLPGGPNGVQFDSAPHIYGGADKSAFAVVWIGGACTDRIDFALTRTDIGLALDMRARARTSGCRLVGIGRTVWIRVNAPIDPTTVAVHGGESPALVPSSSPAIAHSEVPQPTISEQELARERLLLPVFDALSQEPGFQVGGLDPDLNVNGVLVYWSGEFGPEAQAIVNDAKARGIVVTVISVMYSLDELRTIAGQFGTELAAKGIELDGYRIGDPFDQIVVWGADLDESADARRVAKALATNTFPPGL
ncbi:MAG TPA: hypothetical protein VFI15_11885, partial [Candidatus Limnocylindrales bacterium]|nr:hypothetical protein [Candidatus Limnocylindrales bacterium]